MRLPGEGALTSASPGVGSKLPQHPPAGEVVISMRPVSVFANGPDSEIEQLHAELHGQWRQAARAVMILLSSHGLAPGQVAELLDCHPATVRRWIGRFNDEGQAGLADRPPLRAAAAGRAPADQPDRGAAGPARALDPAPDPAVPGPAPGQRADAVPAGPAGGDLAAAEADRPRCPGSRSLRGPDHGPADRAAAPGGSTWAELLAEALASCTLRRSPIR